ncbi:MULTISPECIES: hypothetical protein [unclassified Lentimonas]|uniref:hypothetical protein n=1 Tax=unclassified Lentimonas TaxID=2630993 RepID=UPI00132BF209|nr:MULTISPECIES: hypothetical protein [unclassified Lentimonas]CAA6678133.1 Translation initiation factor 2 [Lentimonas sp. CC4]CAA6685978.1 Translation initiation factor 2 [Lentimonas sp. CC6]CAA7075933.1 Translation initiation factor 2 [Lentimonas sp. CC4]CAA7168640.1 Translation initiation factor 2 [Lentimonas sp. CC21]CAA7181031.1 Translation initiation factor 2 [Lentimonas sp. CC8]
MAEKPADKPKESSKKALDLNTLSGLDFGPSWADENAKRPSLKKFESRGDSRGKGKRSGGGGSRDRRGPGGGARPSGAGRPQGGPGGGRPQGGSEGRPQGGGRPQGRGGDRRGGGRPDQRAIFEPTIKVDIYPQDEAFEALVKRLRSTVRTYQLFEIAHLILEKPERYVVVVENKAKAGEKPAPLFFAVPGHLPFDSEEAAINHVLSNHLDLFFDVEEIEVEAPKGNFQMVNRCSVTGDLLGPPNYHRYQEFLQRHYAAKITGMSFDRFVSKVETVKEQESIDAWVESMKKGARYTVKDRQEGEAESFESLEAVRFFLLQHRKDKIVSSGETIRFAGRDIERLPKGDIRRSVESYVEQQLHFPLDSANNIRGRLRRQKFAVYKKGSKGVSFVCAVKRKFRDSKTVFTPSIQGLIEFIEKHPNTSASKLPKLYIDIDTERQQPAKLEMTEAEVAAAAAAAEAAKAAAAEVAAAAAEAGEAVAEAPETPAVVEAPAPAADAAASTEAMPKVELSEDEQKRLNQLMLDLRWLIVEGYVTEYGDGRLFAAPPMPEAKPKEAKKPAPKKAKAEAVAEPKAAVAEAPVAVEKAKAEEPVAEVAPEAPVVEEAKAEAPVAEVAPEVAEVETTEAPEAPATETTDEAEPKA